MERRNSRILRWRRAVGKVLRNLDDGHIRSPSEDDDDPGVPGVLYPSLVVRGPVISRLLSRGQGREARAFMQLVSGLDGSMTSVSLTSQWLLFNSNDSPFVVALSLLQSFFCHSFLAILSVSFPSVQVSVL
ncbi:hypothetical protein E2C01_058071 [Portunus trituberculatus]|uniref:Uncharacterized protein n=1 Tax=Portunus trituberculatus TaxID=210409 RepID=A0A5B7H1N9_PORTR|nr:hypothetical protein [Portunus trituberculatus]